MCGITGFNWEDRQLCGRMMDSISHRGPDQNGIYVDSHISLGHQRLSIIDLSEKGRQPMTNEDGSVIIVFNGEVYNYKPLREELIKKGHKFNSDTDTEAIIHAYEEYGENCLGHFNGMFVFAIWDTKKKKLFIARDRLGIKPLYYCTDGNKFIFASEIKAILQHDFKRSVNRRAFYSYLSFRYVPGVETMFEGIKKLRPSHYIIYDYNTKKINIKKYYTIPRKVEKNNEQYFIDKLKCMLLDSVKLRLASDVPLGVYLSGGVDSSAVVALMRKIQPEAKINTFSIGFGEYDDPAKELHHARMVAEHFSTDHHETIVKPDVLNLMPKVTWHMDEPVSDATTIPTMMLSKFAKQHVTVNLTGEGADEAFGGYVQYKTLTAARKMTKVVPKLLYAKVGSKVVSKVPVKLLDKFFHYPGSIGTDGRRRVAEFVNSLDDRTKSYVTLISVFSEDEKQKLLKTKDPGMAKKFVSNIKQGFFSTQSHVLDQIYFREMRTWLPDYILNRLDKMTMAYQIESRVPFLDHKFVEFSASIPRQFKDDKYIFRKAVSTILPKEIWARPKHPFFIPIDNWYNKGLRDMAERIISKENVLKSKLLDYDAAKRITQRTGSSNTLHSRQLWALLTFELWHKMFIENDVKKPVMQIDKLF